MIELHDSCVSGLTSEGGRIVLFFEPAYIHQSEGRPGQDVGTGWVQNCRLLFEAASLEGALPELPCNLMDGCLTIGEVVHDGSIPMPLSQQGEISLRLLFYPGCEPTLSGTSVELETTGIPRYVEEFEPHTQNGTIAEQVAAHEPPPPVSGSIGPVHGTLDSQPAPGSSGGR